MSTHDTRDDLAAPGGAGPALIRAGGVRWRVRPANAAGALRQVLDDPESWIARRELVIHDTWLVTIVRVPASGAPGRGTLLRRSHYSKPGARWRDFFRVPGPLRAFRNARVFERAGLSTPHAVAAGVMRRWNVPRAGYLVVEEVPGATPVARLVRQSGGIPRQTVHRIAEEIARLHLGGLIHGDLTINNILLDASGRPWFIDLERARKAWLGVGWRQAVRDFQRLARHVGTFSPAGRRNALRLLKRYCAARGWSGREREFAEAVSRRVRRRMARDPAG